MFGREVLPEFAERDDRRQVTAKAKRLAPAIDAAMAAQGRGRRAAPLGDYSFPALPRQWADASGSGEMRAWLEQCADDRAAGKPTTTAGIAG